MTEPIIINGSRCAQWDQFVKNHNLGWVCHLHSWKEIIETTFPHIRGYLYATIDEKTGEIISGLPVYYVSSWLTGKRLVAAPFATTFDPLFSSDEELTNLLAAIIEGFKKQKHSFIEVRTHLSKLDNVKFSFERVNNFVYHYLDLDRDLRDIKRSFHRTSIRQIINRSSNYDFTIEKIHKRSCLRDYYKLYLSTRKDINLPPIPFKFFDQVFEIFATKGLATFLLLKIDQKPIAGLMLFQLKNRISAECMGWNRKYSAINPSKIIYWEAIKMAHNEGYKIFDFGRTSTSNHNLLDFKRRWGTETTPLSCHIYPADQIKNNKPKEESASYILTQKICEFCPERLYPLLGQLCYRHLG